MKKPTLVYISNDYRADNRTSSHHIAYRLGNDYKILHIEAGCTRTPRASKGDALKIFKKLKTFFSGLRQVNENVKVGSVILPQFISNRIVRWLFLHIVRLQLRLFQLISGIHKPVYWCTHPTLVEVISPLPKSLLVYYCVDDFASMPGVKVSRISELDQQMTEQADLIFTPSRPLYEKKININKNTQLSPHGVDFDHFKTASDPNTQIAEPLKSIDTPIIGFFGLIEHWIDLTLVQTIAEQIADATIIMIGRVAVNLDTYTFPQNVIFTGAKPYEELPTYACAFDVAIIPYIDNNQVFNANPLKLREYLATGKPIVSYSNPEIDKYADVVNIAKDQLDYIRMVKNCLNGNSGSSTEQRLNRVAGESWEARYQNVIAEFNAALQAKNAS